MWMPIRQPAAVLGDREGVVDLGGGGIVDGEGADVGEGQIGGFGRRVDGREAGAVREVFEQETVEVQFVGRGQGRSEQQAGRRLTVFGAGGFRALVSRRLRSGL